MKQRVGLLCLVLLFASVAVNAATDVTGRWKATITFGNQTITGLALLKQSGQRVTGSIGPDERNQHPLDGVVEDGHLTLTTHPRPGRTVAFAKAYLTVDGDDRIAGTTEGGDLAGKATIELVRMKK